MNEAILKDSVDPQYDKDWMFGKVTILAKNPPFEYDAAIYGHLAVLVCAEGWSITHLPSGMKVCDFVEYTDAIQVAELMEDSLDWSKPYEDLKADPFTGQFVMAMKKMIAEMPTKLQIMDIQDLSNPNARVS